MRLGDLLSHRELKLEQLTGGPQSRQLPIQWVHYGDYPTAAEWISDGEVLLTSGYAVGDLDDAAAESTVVALVAAGCTALGYAVGPEHAKVPEALLHAAEVHDLAIFVVPFEVPLIALTRFVFDTLYREKYASLYQAITMSRRLLPVVTNERDPRTVVSIVGTALGRARIAVFDYYGTLIGFAGLQEVDARNMFSHARSAGIPRVSITFKADSDTITVVPIPGAREVVAYLIVATSEPMDERQTLLVEQAVTALSLTVSSLESVRVRRRADAEQLFHEAAAGPVDLELIRDRFEGTAPDEIDTYVVLACRAESPSDEIRESLLARVEDSVARASEAFLATWSEGQVLVLALNPQGNIGERVWADLKAIGIATVLGTSQLRTGLENLREAVYQARSSAATGRVGVNEPGGAALDLLLQYLVDAEGVDSYLHRVLGNLMDADKNHALLQTLQVYLDNGSRPGPTASELHIHRQTLAYRLDRIQQLTGRSLKDGSDLLEVQLALRLRQFRSRDQS
ncbi:PucR family transcriptional regulator [Streptomyces sp. NPDC001698]|uniref:PucR family transcriptional regulator n=1 Tax=unclassified Streptomyces TaxID=2593676 RepID=UPI0036A1B96B